jgi:hypothetical protein
VQRGHRPAPEDRGFRPREERQTRPYGPGNCLLLRCGCGARDGCGAAVAVVDCCWLCGCLVASLMTMMYTRDYLHTFAPCQGNCHCSVRIECVTVRAKLQFCPTQRQLLHSKRAVAYQPYRPSLQVETCVRAMLDSKGAPMDVIEPEKRAKKGSKYGNSGTLCAAHCSIEENPTFTDVSVGAVYTTLYSCSCPVVGLWAEHCCGYLARYVGFVVQQCASCWTLLTLCTNDTCRTVYNTLHCTFQCYSLLRAAARSP